MQTTKAVVIALVRVHTNQDREYVWSVVILINFSILAQQHLPAGRQVDTATAPGREQKICTDTDLGNSIFINKIIILK